MQHPLEPLSRVLRLSVVTDTAVPIVGRPPNLLEVIRDRGWLQGLQLSPCSPCWPRYCTPHHRSDLNWGPCGGVRPALP